MHNCYACSFYETARKRRKRRKTLTRCTKNHSKAKLKSKQWINFQSTGELAVVLDPRVVVKYLKAKRTIDEILRPEDRRDSYLDGYQRVNVNNDDEPFYEFRTQSSPHMSFTTETFSLCMNETESNASIKEELLSDRKSPVALDDVANLFGDDDELQMVEIPAGSNIVVNPMNSRFTFSQIDPSLINDNEANDLMNASVFNDSQQPETAAVPKYVYNPMNNIVDSSQTCEEESDGNNNLQPNAMPEDVQFAPGEYVMEDDFLNDNYGVVNTFELETVDADSNQSVELVEESSATEQNLTMQMVDALVNPDDADSSKNEEVETLEAAMEEQESILQDEVDCKPNIETDWDECACGKCNKRFKMLHNLRKHELTCGTTFQYNCLFCSKSSMLSHTIKCHMSNRHVPQVAIFGLKELMETVIKKRKENKGINLNKIQSEEIQVVPDVESNFAPMDNLEKVKKNDRRKQSFTMTIGDITFEIKKEMVENSNFDEDSVYPTVENSYASNDETDARVNFKPSKEYVDALCSNCNINLKSIKSGSIKCCPNCRSPLIYKCAVCRKCFSKYLSICGHVKYHPQSNLSQITTLDDKHYCGYCNYETVQKSQLLRHLLGHIREKSVKIKREYLG